MTDALTDAIRFALNSGECGTIRSTAAGCSCDDAIARPDFNCVVHAQLLGREQFKRQLPRNGAHKAGIRNGRVRITHRSATK